MLIKPGTDHARASGSAVPAGLAASQGAPAAAGTSAPAGSADHELYHAVERHAQAARGAAAVVPATASRAGTPSHQAAPAGAQQEPQADAAADPRDWLGAQLGRFLTGETVDPYAELMLRRAGFAPVQR